MMTTPELTERLRQAEESVLRVQTFLQGEYQVAQRTANDALDRLTRRDEELNQAVADLGKCHAELQRAHNLLQKSHNELHDHMDAPRTGGQRRKLVDPKSTVPNKFSGSDKAGENQWRMWSRKVKKYVGAVYRDLRKAMDRAENVDEPIELPQLGDYGISESEDAELEDFLSWATEGDAWEIVDGCHNLPAIEAWRKLSRRYSPKGPATKLSDTRKLNRVTRVKALSEVMNAIQ